MRLWPRRASNAATLKVVPFWGPDQYSLSMATANTIWTNPFSPANRGPGLFGPAPASQVQGTKSDAYLQPRQEFRGLARLWSNPQQKTVANNAHFPSTAVAVNPVLLSMGRTDTGIAALYNRGF